MPLSTLDQAPLKKALPPSSRAILRQQSMVPVYMISAKEGKKKEKKKVSYEIKLNIEQINCNFWVHV